MDLHLWQLTLDARSLMEFARTQHLLHREADQGYVVHAALAAVFGEAVPTPFVIEGALSPDAPARAPGVEVVLAYSPYTLDTVRQRASKEHQHLVRWTECRSRPVPSIGEGTRLAFTTLVVPVVRSRARTEGRSEHGRGHGRELDAFVAECLRVGRDVRVDRAAVYRDWLALRLRGEEQVAFGGAELEDYSLQAFRRVRLLRKEAGPGARKRHVLDRPEALVSGTLRVTDEGAFRNLIARGIGRHRAFGFGMLLLRRGG